MQNEEKNKIPCPICGEMFDKRGLNGHMSRHKKEKKEDSPEGVSFEFDEIHQEPPENNPESFECGSCGTEIKEGVPVCPGCGGAFEW